MSLPLPHNLSGLANPMRGVVYGPLAGVLLSAVLSTASVAVFGGIAIGGTLLSHFLITSAIGAALYFLKPKQSTDASDAFGGYTVNAKGTALDHPIIYGEVKVGGALLYDESTDDYKYLHRIIAVAGHECESLGDVYLDDELLTLDGSGDVTAPSEFVDKIRIIKHLGADDQVADTALIAASAGKWTSAHRLRGIAYLYIRLLADQDAFPGGVPTFTVKVKGKKVYDPRTGVVAWTENAALNTRDYFVSDYGLSAYNGTHTNLQVQSNTLSSGWTVDGTVATDDVATAIDGSTTADTLIEDTGVATLHRITETGVGVDNVDMCTSFQIKANGRDKFSLYIFDADATGNYVSAIYDLAAQTAVFNVAIGNAVNGQASVKELEDGWFRVAISGTANTAGSAGDINTQLRLHDAVNAQSYTGDGVSGVTIGGTQIETGLVPTSLIQTSGLPITLPLEDEMDDLTIMVAANICEEDVSLAGPGTEQRYTLNGTFTTGATPQNIIRGLLTAMGGSLFYGQGLWQLFAAAYVAPTLSLDETDARSSIQVTGRHSRRDNFNRVKGTFSGAETNWKVTDFPSVSSATFLSEDNGEENAVDYPLPFTNSSATAQRLAKIILFRNREQITVSGAFGLEALKARVGEVIQYSNSRLGWVNKPFEVVKWKFGIKDKDLIVDLVLREISSAVFDWNADEATFLLNNTALPDPRVTSIPGITLSDTVSIINQNVTSTLIIDLSASNSGYVALYEARFRKSSDSVWSNLGTATGTRFKALEVEDVEYDVQARTISSLGVRSDWAQQNNFAVTALSSPPEDVANFRINFLSTSAHLEWDAVSDLDLSHYIIRYSSDPTTNDYNTSVRLVNKVSRPATSVTVPARAGTYFIRAVDKLGNKSVNPTRIATTFSNVEGLNDIQTNTEHPAFTGTYTDTVLNTTTINGVILDPYTSAPSSGDFQPTSIIDLGGIYVARITSSILAIRIDDTGALFDATSGLFDSVSGLFDGSEVSDVDVISQISITEDDPTGSPTWGPWVDFIAGDFSGWGFRFRLLLSSESDNVTPKVIEYSVTAEMQDRIEADLDIVSGAGSYAVSFSPAFKSLKGLGISAQGLQTGDYYELTAKTAAGFTIIFKNAAGTAISRTFDYIAKGYGRLS